MLSVEQQGAREWGARSVEDTLASFGVRAEEGLSAEEAMARLGRYGPNRLNSPKRTSLFSMAFSQLKSPLALVLIFSGIAMLFLQEKVNALVILLALLVNVAIGVFQEERAGKAFEALRGTGERRALVLRGGKKMNIAEADIVPGDIIFLDAGFAVPADVRILRTTELSINESMLTGEWLPVSKESQENIRHEGGGEVSAHTGTTSLAYMGTLVESGTGLGVAVATGVYTEVGAIARELTIIHDTATPLQKGIRHLLRTLGFLVVALLVFVFAIGVFRGEPLYDMLLVGVALAVATIPEGVPAAVTVVLALGMEAILKRGGLVRNLLAAETLGATTYILTDKTGTLTEAKMKLGEIILLEEAEANEEDTRAVLRAAILASDAFVEEGSDAPKKLTVHGRPLEKAIVMRGLEEGLSPEVLFHEEPRHAFLKFDSARRFAVSLHKRSGRETQELYITGAPEVLLEHADSLFTRGKNITLSQGERRAFGDLITRKSASGLRLLAVAHKKVTWEDFPENPDSGRRDLVAGCTFLGVLAFIDPVRQDAIGAIGEARAAGARVIMITGDNPETARAIARTVGITESGAEDVLRGEDIERMSDDELFLALARVSIIARALPAHKLKVARVLKERGEVVAMTGDGINDAPALRAANIGVAVGSGTEVAKEAADLVLLDDSFSVIVSAIEEGRRIIDNLRKILAYLLSTGFSEIIVVGAAFAAGAPLPFLPVHILLANIIQEGIMSFPFAFEKVEPGAMRRDPRSHSSKRILSPELIILMTIITSVTGALLSGLFFFLLYALELPIDRVRTIMFAALSLGVISFTFSLKSLSAPLWQIALFSNRFLIIALSINACILAVTLSIPFLRDFLSFTELSLRDFALLGIVAMVNVLTVETVKFFVMRRRDV